LPQVQQAICSAHVHGNGLPDCHKYNRQFAQHMFMVTDCLIATSTTGNFERGISGTVKYIYFRLDEADELGQSA